MPSSRYERAARSAGYRSIAGVDEAGRGALFGPVFAAAVVLDPDRPDPRPRRQQATGAGAPRGAGRTHPGARRRLGRRAAPTRSRSTASIFCRRRVWPCSARSSRLHTASRLSADRRRHGGPAAVAKSDHSWRCAELFDRRRVHPGQGRRDAALAEWDRVSPEYGFSHNKGYGTPDHLAALEQFGPTTLHRFSFEPVTERLPLARLRLVGLS